MNSLSQLSLVVLVASCWLSQPLIGAPSSWTTKVAFIADFSQVTVDNMPLEVRNVPIHPSDVGIPGPITQTAYSKTGLLTVSAFLTKEYAFGWFGVGLDWIVYPWPSAQAERNYTNAVDTSLRGYGAALTFVDLGRRGALPGFSSSLLDVITNFTPAVTAGVKLGENWRIGADLSYQRIVAYTGWDRYDGLDINRTYHLASGYPLAVYAEYRGIAFGATLPLFNRQTEMGKLAGARLTVGPFIRFSKRF